MPPVSPALMALFIPAGLLAVWLFLHKDADVEQRIDRREAVHERESAEFDRDFARLNGDKAAEEVAIQRAAEASGRVKAAEEARQARAKEDQRAAVRGGVDTFLKPEQKGENQ